MRRILLAVAIFLQCSLCLAGAWGPGSFDNDDAIDWIAQCTQSNGAEAITAALQVASKPGLIDAADGAMAIAAAEVVAAAKGRPGKTLPPALRIWIKRQSTATIVKLAPVARKALANIKEPTVSELGQLWGESPGAGWAQAVTELDLRLQ